MKSRMAPYEAVVILHPDSRVEDQKEIFKKNKSIIEGLKGSIHSLETWGKRTLPTPIEKHRRAHFFHTLFQADTQTIRELERVMNINEQVLRFVHVRLDERLPLPKHLETFKKGLAESLQREKDREAKAQLRRTMAAQRAQQAEG